MPKWGPSAAASSTPAAAAESTESNAATSDWGNATETASTTATAGWGDEVPAKSASEGSDRPETPVAKHPDGWAAPASKPASKTIPTGSKISWAHIARRVCPFQICSRGRLTRRPTGPVPLPSPFSLLLSLPLPLLFPH